MLILHAGWLNDRLSLWGEAGGEHATRKTRIIKKKGLSAPPHPYAAEPRILLNALSPLDMALEIPKAKDSLPYAWLPAQGGRPLPSTPLLSDNSTSNETEGILPFGIAALPMPHDLVIGFLCACMNKELLAPGILLGDDVRFWAAVLRFAGGVVTRQRFLPGLKKDGELYRARWNFVSSGEDASRVCALAQSMPAACRALSSSADTPPSAPALSLLTDFIDAMVDRIVRLPLSPPKAASSAKVAKSKAAVHHDSLHEQWLHALRAADGRMEGTVDELRRLAEQINTWQRPVAVSAAAPFRLCFRLEEPDAEAEISPRKKKAKAPDWYVRYLLQDAADPSLLVPVQDVWSGKKTTAKFLNRFSASATEYLLMSLGQAAPICPPIEASLKAPAPSGVELDAEGALHFLQDSTPLLKQMGFDLLLPSWWTGRGTKQRISLQAWAKKSALRGGNRSMLDAVAPLEWKAALGEQEMTLKELMELARLKVPLVKIRGQWVHLNPEDVDAAIRFLKSKPKSDASIRDLIQMALGRAPVPAGLEFSGVSADGWIGDLLDRLKGNTAWSESDPPPQFKGTLRPYQARGYSWLAFLRQWGLGACLADDMGLGKTIQTLALIQRDWHENEKRPVLLVCPTSVVSNWQKEAQRFTPELPVMIHHGVTRKKGETFIDTVQDQAIVLTSYALLHRDLEFFQKVRWNGVILDEAQNIKNPETKQAKAARALQAEYRVALTGTPVENNVGDLWSLMEFLNPGFLGTQTEFKRNFFVPIQALQDAGTIQKLKQITGPFILRRLKTDKTIISDLPEKMEMKVFCTLTKEQASLYTAVVQEAEQRLEEAEGIQRKGIVLATLSKLKQVCNHPAQFLGDRSEIGGRSGKLARLAEMVEELISVGDRALIFTQFTEMGDMLQRYLQEQFGQEVLFLHGGTTKKQRDRMVERFQQAEGPRLFLLSLKAGGTGLNLTRANHVFHFDRWWNPAVENQATDRAFRIGQTRNVQIHKFLCSGTLEERIDQMIESKKELAAGLVGTGESWLTKLSTRELKNLFTLDRSAVAE